MGPDQRTTMRRTLSDLMRAPRTIPFLIAAVLIFLLVLVVIPTPTDSAPPPSDPTPAERSPGTATARPLPTTTTTYTPAPSAGNSIASALPAPTTTTTTTTPPAPTSTAPASSNVPGYAQGVPGAEDVPPIMWAIARCEGALNPAQWDPWTLYNFSGSSASGPWQIIRGTWAGYGGYANAADAPPAVQIEKAMELYHSRGTQPWNASRSCWG